MASRTSDKNQAPRALPIAGNHSFDRNTGSIVIRVEGLPKDIDDTTFHRLGLFMLHQVLRDAIVRGFGQTIPQVFHGSVDAMIGILGGDQKDAKVEFVGGSFDDTPLPGGKILS